LLNQFFIRWVGSGFIYENIYIIAEADEGEIDDIVEVDDDTNEECDNGQDYVSESLVFLQIDCPFV